MAWLTGRHSAARHFVLVCVFFGRWRKFLLCRLFHINHGLKLVAFKSSSHTHNVYARWPMVEAEIVTPAPSLHKSRHKMDVEGDEPVYSTASSEMVTLHPSPAIDSTFLNFGKNAQKHDVPRWMPSCLRLLSFKCTQTLTKHFRYRVRFLILFIGMVYLTSTRANELSFNFSVICMTSNLTVNGVEPLDITPNEVSIIFACIGVGALFFVSVYQFD